MKLFIEKDFVFQTYLPDILKLIPYEIEDYNFILGHIETNGGLDIIKKWISKKEGINYIIPGVEIGQIINEPQFIWGVFSIIKKNINIDKLIINTEFCIDGNGDLFSDSLKTFWIEESELEIIAFDGSTIIIQTNNKETLSFIKNRLHEINK